MADKYMVFKVKEVKKFLTDEMRKNFDEIMATLRAKRAELNLPDDKYFVLNMKDKYSQGGIEGYIAAVEADTANQYNSGVLDAVNHARKTRSEAMLRIDPRLPT